MGKLDDAERIEPATLEEWSRWLATHHADSGGVWLVTLKRSTGRQPFSYEASVVEALRYGWVDAVQRSIDDERSMQWFAPRKPTSGWARPNKERVARLEREGRLEDAGRAAVEVAKANGAWTMFDDAENLVEPEELTRSLDADAAAREAWDGFPPSARKVILAWIAMAKRPETRQRRIAQTVAAAAKGERAFP